VDEERDLLVVDQRLHYELVRLFIVETRVRRVKQYTCAEYTLVPTTRNSCFGVQGLAFSTFRDFAISVLGLGFGVLAFWGLGFWVFGV